MPNTPEFSGGFIAAAAGVLRAPQLTHREISARGGRAKTPAKLQAAAQPGKGESGAGGAARHKISRRTGDPRLRRGGRLGRDFEFVFRAEAFARAEFGAGQAYGDFRRLIVSV